MTDRDLTKAIQKRMTLRVTTRVPMGENTHGFPLDFSKEFWLLQEERDFILDGYVVIPTRNIAEVRFGKFERAMDKMLHAEGIASRVKAPKKIDLSTFGTLFESLRERGRNIILQVAAKRNNTRLVIGPIIDRDEEGLHIHYFSSLGKWDRTPTFVAYKDICEVAFDSAYLRIFSKYLPPRKTSQRQ